MSQHSFLATTRTFVRSCAVSVALFVGTNTSVAADDGVTASLCGALKKLLPEVRTYRPEGARAQLTMEVAERFEYDAVKLRQVKAEIDKVTSASCAKEREGMLGILKMKSLAEALN